MDTYAKLKDTYAKLKDGRTMIVFGEETVKKFYWLMPVGYDINVDVAEEVPYSDIVNIDTNLEIL